MNRNPLELRNFCSWRCLWRVATSKCLSYSQINWIGYMICNWEELSILVVRAWKKIDPFLFLCFVLFWFLNCCISVWLEERNRIVKWSSSKKATLLLWIPFPILVHFLLCLLFLLLFNIPTNNFVLLSFTSDKKRTVLVQVGPAPTYSHKSGTRASTRDNVSSGPVSVTPIEPMGCRHVYIG